MALSPVLPYKLPELKQLVLAKTNIGGFFFDAFLRIDHSSKLTITKHPVQTGAAITDHAFMEPAELTMEVGMSDVSASLVSGQFTTGWSRSTSAFQVLQELQKLRIPIQVTTRFKTYQNMLIESISVPDDYKTLYGMRAQITMREILVAVVTIVKISARPQVTNTTKRGTPEPVAPDESLLSKAINYFTGK